MRARLRWASRCAWAFAGCGIVLDAAHAATGSRMGLAAVAWTTWLPVGVLGTSALAALLASAAADRGARLTPLLLGLGIACYAPGTAMYTQIVAKQSSQAFPNLADFCWMTFYPLALAALMLIFRRSLDTRRPALLADAGIGALTALAVGSVLLADVVLRGATMSAGGSIVYSLGDQLLVGAAVGTFAVFAWRPPRALVILTIGLLLQAFEDGIYLHYLVHGRFPADGWLIVFWLTNFTIISAAVVFPGHRRSGRLDYESTIAGLIAVGFALVLVFVTIVIMADPHPWAPAIAIDSAALLLVVVRMGLALRSNLRLLKEARDDSRTDPLTGLGNRRDLRERIESELGRTAEDRGALTLAVYDLDGFKAYNDSYGHPAGDALLRRLATRLAAAAPPPAHAFRLGGDEFCVLIPERVVELTPVVSACQEALSESGDAFEITSSYGVASIPIDGDTLGEALSRADERLYVMKMNRQRRGQANAVGVLRRVLEETEPDVQSHQTEVARLAVRTGRRLGMNPAQLAVLSQAAEFHDVGKIAIPDTIVNKPGPLDQDERAYMNRHTLIGERFLLAVPGMERVARIVRSSHERVDGRGYPDGLPRGEIPLEALIIAACDAFHAMTTERPYNAIKSIPEALAELHRCAGTQFDEAIIEALSHVIQGEHAARGLHHPARPTRSGFSTEGVDALRR